MRKQIVLVLALLLLLPGALAFTVSLEPNAMYETNTATFNVSVDNFAGTGIITDILLNTGIITVDSVQAFTGWYNNFAAYEVHWYGGTIETNMARALFLFTSTLPKVSADTVVNLTGTITYPDSSTNDFIISLSILNDETPPDVHSYSPKDYARANKADQAIIINASDLETGVDSATYSFNDCSGSSTTVTLACNAGLCTGTADFSAFDDGDSACYEIKVLNKAGETRTITGTLTFDGTAPVVTLVSPINNDYAGLTSTFVFRASDNMADELTCSVSIEGNVVYTATADNGSDEQFTPDFTGVSEGSNDWSVRCEDRVGLSTTSEDDFTFDKTPPAITLNSPSNGSIIGNRMIDISVADNGVVDTVNYSQSLDTASWPDGINTLTVIAVDKARNVASAEFVFYVDRTPPTITLIMPVDGSTFDYNAVFSIMADDNYDSTLDCAIETDVNASASGTVQAGIVSNISLILPLGSFAWYARCVDDAGNSALSGTWHGTAVDMTGPIITLSDVRYVVRGQDLNVNAKIIDISGVDSASATFGTDTIALSNTGDDYTGKFAIDASTALGNYTFTVDAKDTNGYTSSASDTFEVIEGYVITINVPASVTPGASVSVTGSVVRDDGVIPSGSVLIEYDGGNATVALDASGTFSHTFIAPSTEGNYAVKVKYETERFVYSRQKTYGVVSGSGSSGASRGRGYEGYSISVEGAGITPTVQPESSHNSELQTEDEASASELMTEDETTVEEILPPEEPRSPIVGGATSVLAVLGKAVKWWILLLALMSLGLGMYYAFKNRKPDSDGKIDWEGYFK
ncbi:MAG: hypothetical protein QW666_00115 [Candidatus Woesearchaeota archaeon]